MRLKEDVARQAIPDDETVPQVGMAFDVYTDRGFHAGHRKCWRQDDANSQAGRGPPYPALGKKLYAGNCASCHGAELTGNNKGPSMLHKVCDPSHHSDIACHFAAKNDVHAHHWKFGDAGRCDARHTFHSCGREKKAGIN